MNKIKITIVVAVLFAISTTLGSQTTQKYWIKFKDKNGSSYSISKPSEFLSAKSIARRVKHNAAIDITDLPVNQDYINQVNATGAVVFQRSKWMNAAIVIADSSQLIAIKSLTCVLNSSPIARLKSSIPENLTPVDTDKLPNSKRTQVNGYDYGPSLVQVSQIGADCLHAKGFRGNGVTIALFDSGFNNVDKNATFDSLRNENRLLNTRDIVAGDNSVYTDDSHGAMVLSCIAGNTPGQLIGTGPKVGIYLIRTEDVASEKPIEENNWIVAAEYADSVGVDIISTSLGYNTFDIGFVNHVYSDLDGKKIPMSVASTMAARKGIFVLNAAGNEGSSPWKFISVPADADSICTVGAVDASGNIASFSSVGPTADERIKPDLSSMGKGSYVCGAAGDFFAGDGTSFATPILAGAVACLIQANPTKTNMEILKALKATATQSNTPDNSKGWGIPNMCEADTYLKTGNNGVSGIVNQENIKPFPNPANTSIHLKLNQKMQHAMVTDVLGKQFELDFTENQSHHFELKIDKLCSGLYILSIITNDGLMNSKFVKE